MNMAFVQASCNRVACLLNRLNVRQLSNTTLARDNNIKKSVFISQSNDIYTNLALEEWLYKNFDFKSHQILLLAQNDPCIVIGRNQNPWTETNLSDLQNVENEVNLARTSRNGGTVYQDNGSLTLSFFSTRDQHDSKYNMEIVARSIFRELNCSVNIGREVGLFLRNKRISNESVKLGKENCYHNMSLMVASNKVMRDMAIRKHSDVSAINIGAIGTVVSPKIMNICEENPNASVASLTKAVGWEFLRTKALSLKDGGMELAYQQKGFHLINPTENWFPGLNEIRNRLSSWDWCYGKTPKFNITQSFTVPGSLLHRNTGACSNLNVTMTVENGLIAEIALHMPLELNSFAFMGDVNVFHTLKGKRFSVQAFEDLEDSLDSLLDEKHRFVTECVKQVMTCA